MDNFSAEQVLLNMGETHLVNDLKTHLPQLLLKSGWTWCGVTCSCVACNWPSDSVLEDVMNSLGDGEKGIICAARRILKHEFNRRFLTPCDARIALRQISTPRSI